MELLITILTEYNTEMIVYGIFFAVFFFIISIRYYVSTILVIFGISAGLIIIGNFVPIPQPEMMMKNFLLFIIFCLGGNLLSLPFVFANWFIELVESSRKS